jgi:hypothetical protein
MSAEARRLRLAAVERAVRGSGDALYVAFAFNVITRLADTFEFEVGARASFEAGAKHLLTRGYT